MNRHYHLYFFAFVFIVGLFIAHTGSSQFVEQNTGFRHNVQDTCRDSVDSIHEAVDKWEKGRGRRDSMGISNYINAARLSVNSPYGPITRPVSRYRHAIEVLREATVRFGQNPEVYWLLSDYYAYLGCRDSALIYLDSAEIACKNDQVAEKFRQPCFDKDGEYSIQKIERYRQELIEKLEQEKTDTKTNR